MRPLYAGLLKLQHGNLVLTDKAKTKENVQRLVSYLHSRSYVISLINKHVARFYRIPPTPDPVTSDSF